MFSSKILARSETRSIELTWALSLLKNNPPDVEDGPWRNGRHCGRDRVVERSGINKLDYLPAIIKETLRLCPVAPPLLVPREAIEDCKLGHAHDPASTRMVVNVWKRHMSTWTPTCRAATSSFCHLDPGGDHVSAPEWPLKSSTSPWSALFMVWLVHL